MEININIRKKNIKIGNIEININIRKIKIYKNC